MTLTGEIARKHWRVGRTVPINVYEDDGDTSRPICQCHTVEDAKRIVRAVNAEKMAERIFEKTRERAAWIAQYAAQFRASDDIREMRFEDIAGSESAK